MTNLNSTKPQAKSKTIIFGIILGLFALPAMAENAKAMTLGLWFKKVIGEPPANNNILAANNAANDPLAAPTIIVDTAPLPELTKEDKNEQLWLHTLNGNLRSAIDLLNSGADIHFKSQHKETLLHVSASRGHVHLAQFYIENGISVHAKTSKGWTPLHHAVRFGHAQVANLLVMYGADPHKRTTDTSKKSPIEIAIDLKDARMVRIISRKKK